MVIWTKPAKEDLKQIYHYIFQDSEYYAKHVVDTILSKSEYLDTFPEIGRIVKETEDESIREIIVYSYRMIYQLEVENIVILAVIHSRRNNIEDRLAED